MNTIPLTFDEHQVNRTVLGGKTNDSPDALNISVILLNSSGSHLKLHVFENLLACNFSSVISIEHDSKNSTIEDISKKFPAVKFIVPLEDATDGEMINMAMSEISSDYVLVLRDSLYIQSGIILPHLAERLTGENAYCVVPRLTDSSKGALLMHFSPVAEKGHFAIRSSSVVTDGMNTVYPLDYVALYNRKKFIQLGGFDYSIKSAYWQNLDLALRSWLWGEETKITTLLEFSYINDGPVEDKTVNLDYLRFHLKNEMPCYKNDEFAYVRPLSFLRFLFCSSCGFLEAKQQFDAGKIWIRKNRYRFKTDLKNLISGWSD